jgi:hypothetical protein
MQTASFWNRNLPVGIIACLILAGIPAALAADGTNATPTIGGKVIVMSFPEGAAIYLNGEYLGIAPLIRQNITPGKYTVMVSKAGYQNTTIPIELWDGSTREIGVNLEEATRVPATPAGSGSIAVDSDPGGAFVTLDGNSVGTTPSGRAALNLNNIPAGNHTVTVELAGYPPYTSTVTVIKNQVVLVRADLEIPAPAVTDTPVAATSRKEPVPLSPLAAVAAAGLAGLFTASRRS